MRTGPAASSGVAGRRLTQSRVDDAVAVACRLLELAGGQAALPGVPLSGCLPDGGLVGAVSRGPGAGGDPGRAGRVEGVGTPGRQA